MSLDPVAMMSTTMNMVKEIQQDLQMADEKYDFLLEQVQYLSHLLDKTSVDDTKDALPYDEFERLKDTLRDCLTFARKVPKLKTIEGSTGMGMPTSSPVESSKSHSHLGAQSIDSVDRNIAKAKVENQKNTGSWFPSVGELLTAKSRVKEAQVLVDKIKEHMAKLNFAMNLSNLEEAREAKKREIEGLEKLHHIELQNKKMLKQQNEHYRLEREMLDREQRAREQTCSFPNVWALLFGVSTPPAPQAGGTDHPHPPKPKAKPKAPGDHKPAHK